MSERSRGKTGNKTRRWGPRMVLILMAMTAVSFAFFAGLYLQARLPLVPSLIGGFAIFMMLIGTLPKPKSNGSALPDDLQRRLALFENEIVQLSNQLEEFEGLTGKIGEIDQLAPAVHNLENLLDEMAHKSTSFANEQYDEANASFSELSEKLKLLDNRINSLDTQMANEQLRQQTQLQMQIEELDRLVRQMAENNRKAAEEKPEPPAPKTTMSPPRRVISDRVKASMDLPSGMESFNREEQRILKIIIDAIEQRRIEIYLQPVVELPRRKTVYYEVFTRLRNAGHGLVLPDMFIPVAERAGLMPLIDNMMLLRAVKIIHQMDERSRTRGLFCTLSAQSLVDPDFFPQLVAYLEKNRDLAGRVIFEIAQSQKISSGQIERESMHRLSHLGFQFSLDKVIDLDIDYDELARSNFKFVRISADRLLNGMKELGARIHGADKASYLQRFGIELIVEKIETERELASLADYNIKLGQGYLFAEPRPVRPEVLGERAA